MSDRMKDKVINATKWSSITEITAKIVSPITNMILARILAPEAFGVVATVTMIVSFAEMFTDSGFQKYLVQHEFESDEERYQNANVAFWTNFFISIILWGIITLFRDQLAEMVGNPGLGNVVAIACFQLPLSSFSSIQMALYRRDFDFKTLFLVRIVAVCVPFFVTIPLALLGLNYWALIIGTIFMKILNAVILTVKSPWKPQLFFKVSILKEMLSFSIWSLIEAISIWFTQWIDVFIISNLLTQYYLGIYKTSTTMVNSVMSLIAASTVPVLFSALSRLQNNPEKFNSMYFTVQRYVSILVFPLGVGIYLYSDLATQIFLGNKWNEASNVIGIWALTSAIMIVLGHFNSEVFRAKGRPKLSFLSQVLHLVILVPVCIISSNYGFWPLVYSRAWVRIQGLLVGMAIMKWCIKFPIEKVFMNVMPTFISSVLMGILAYLLRQISMNVIWSIISIFVCAIFYFCVLSLFPGMKEELLKLLEKVIPNRKAGITECLK
ncbi:MAG: lipopolysaccharide biosynthesis protein [Clostridiales bacterium]|nr:lipopolysaccharide biosynthesis protein [Clostridiales bacterium]